MGWHKIENQAMLPSSTTSVYKDIGYITEDEDDELLVSTTPNNKLGGRRQSRGSFHKRDSLQSISCTTAADDDSTANDDVSSPTTNVSIKTDNTPHIIENDTPSTTTNTNANNDHTLFNIDDQVKITNVNHIHYGIQGVIIKQTRCYSTVQLKEDDEMIRIYHSSLALVDDDEDDVDDDDGQVDHSYQRDGSMAVVSDCSDIEEDDDDEDEDEEEPEEENAKQDTSRSFGVEQASHSSTNNNIVNSMRQRNIELLHKNQLLEQSNSRYKKEARLVKKENEHLYDRLKCPYCYEVKDEMYVMLPCGHRTCFDCHFMIGSKCPQGCREAVQKVKLYH